MELPNDLPPSGYQDSYSKAEQTIDTLQIELTGAVLKDVQSLSSYWELRNRGEIMVWGLQFLEDMTRMHQLGWKLMIIKELNNKDADFKMLSVPLELLVPQTGSYFRFQPKFTNT